MSFQRSSAIFKDTFLSTMPGLICQRTDREISSKSRHQMPASDLKLTEFKMLLLIIPPPPPPFSYNRPSSIEFWKVVTFVRVHLSNLINHCQARNCYILSLMYQLLFWKAQRNGSAEWCGYANSHPALNLIYLINGLRWVIRQSEWMVTALYHDPGSKS